MTMFKIRYEGIDGNRYEKPVVVTEDIADVIEEFLNKVYNVDHPIRYIYWFGMEEKGDLK